MKSLGDAPYIDLFSDEYRDDAGGVLDRVRSETGLVQTVAGPMVIRHDLVHARVSTRRLHSSLLHWAQLQGVTNGPIVDNWRHFLLELNGDSHTPGCASLSTGHLRPAP